MPNEYPLVVTTQFEIEATKWLTALAQDENVAVLFFPKTDRQRRLHQLLENRKLMQQVLGDENRYIFQIFDFSTAFIEEEVDLREHIARQLNFAKQVVTAKTFEQWMQELKKENIRLILMLPEAEKLLSDTNKHILSYLSYLLVTHPPIIKVVSFYESDVTHPMFRQVLPSSGELFDYMFYFPMYQENDVLNFLRYLQKKWNITLENKTEKEIIRACGGHFWLVKETVREIVNNGKWNPETHGMKFRLQAIYNSLLSSEISVLKKIIARTIDLTEQEEHSLQHLKKLNLVNLHSEIQIGLLHDFIITQGQSSNRILLKDGKAILNQVPLETFFSRQEYRVFKLFLERPGAIVTREDVASRIWPTNTMQHYSDWAIDKLIARLRHRLVELTLSPKMIQTLRGKGYRMEARNKYE